MIEPVVLPPLAEMSEAELKSIAEFFRQVALDARNDQLRSNALAREDFYLDELARRFYARERKEVSR
jgi:hypothetical protein